jgi:hypothetical protein
MGVDDARRDPDTVGWVQIAAEQTRRVVSVCTGSFLAAQAGLIDGCVATTRLRRTDPHRGCPTPTRGDRRHRHGDSRALRLRQRRDFAPQFRSTTGHLARPVPQDVRLTKGDGALINLTNGHVSMPMVIPKVLLTHIICGEVASSA